MRTGYKLTLSDKTTYKRTQWGENITHSAEKGKMEFCSWTAIHFYEDPLVAVFCNPIHGNFKKPLLWEGIAYGYCKSDGVKSVCKRFTTVKQIPLPIITTEQRIKIAIRCAMAVYDEPNWVKWAENWLSGMDRTSPQAARAARGAEAAAWAAESARAAAWATAWAAQAAEAATRAAAWAAAWAAQAAEAAARAAQYTTEAARAGGTMAFSLLQIIKEVISE